MGGGGRFFGFSRIAVAQVEAPPAVPVESRVGGVVDFPSGGDGQTARVEVGLQGVGIQVALDGIAEVFQDGVEADGAEPCVGRVADAVGSARQRIGDGEGSVGELEEDGGAFRPEVVEFFQQAVGEVDLHVAEVDLVGCPRRLEGDERLSAAGAAADEGVAAAGGQENVGGRNAAFVCGAGNGDIAREPGDGTAVVETAGGGPCAKMDAGEGAAVEAAQVDGCRLAGEFDRDSACGGVVRGSGQGAAPYRQRGSGGGHAVQFESTARDGNMGCAEAGSVDKFETAFFQRDLAGDGIAAVAEDEGASPLLGQEAGAVQDSAQGHSLSVAEADESSVLARARKGHGVGGCPARAACGRGESSVA